MKNIPIAPVLVGRGMAGKAILRSLDIVSHVDLELQLLPVRIADRGTPLKSYLAEDALNVLFLANPSGLHAQSILEGIQAGFTAIAADKPVCVRPEEISLLRNTACLRHGLSWLPGYVGPQNDKADDRRRRIGRRFRIRIALLAILRRTDGVEGRSCERIVEK